MYTLLSPTLLVRDPKVIRDVLVKDFNVFHHRGFMADPKVSKFVDSIYVSAIIIIRRYNHDFILILRL